MVCFGVLKGGEKKHHISGRQCRVHFVKNKNPRKGVIEWSVFLLISRRAVLAWCKPAERLQSGSARCERT